MSNNIDQSQQSNEYKQKYNKIIDQYNQDKSVKNINRDRLKELEENGDNLTEKEYMRIVDLYLEKLLEQHINLVQQYKYKQQILSTEKDDRQIFGLILNKLSQLCYEDQIDSLKFLYACKNLGEDYFIERYVGLCIYCGLIELVDENDICRSQIMDLIKCIKEKRFDDYKQYLDKYSLILLKNGIYTLYARGLLWCKEEPTDQTQIYVQQKYMSIGEIKEQLEQNEICYLQFDNLTDDQKQLFNIKFNQ